ncbi:MAG: NAD(P)-dependent oxidoreductase [Verrucomicrobia bacterium]|nr:NAD(P)-dependent oxidoreductase [Verrucomicrobiota bacterium]
MTPTVLVTGGSGFIGTWVIKELLGRDCRVVVFDLSDGGERWRKILGPARERITLVRGDILDEAALARALDEHFVSHVIHLVALLTPDCQRDPVRGCEINVLATTRLFELIRTRRQAIKGFSYASSISIYGSTNAEKVATSVGELQPPSFYGAYKLANELIAHQYWLHYGVPSVGLRPPIVFGSGRETGQSAEPTHAVRAVARGESFKFTFSGGYAYEFVEDTARAFVRAALEVHSGAHVVDLPGQQTSIEEIVALLDRLQPGAAARLTITGEPLPQPAVKNSLTIEFFFPDWHATPLEEGFRRTLEFYRT